MLRSLFVDFNAYFASVEQHLNPKLRGRPVAVAPVQKWSGCCIAASYEAKKFGVKTGMRVGEAQLLCPGLVVVAPRHNEYVAMHHRLVKAVETVLPVEGVHSIDEMACRLGTGQREPEAAIALAHRVKSAIREQVGPTMRCSIGIAPNRFLAKVGTDMQKPDGLVVIQQHELPQRLFTLKLQDLPGIGPRMGARLESRGVHTVEQLCAATEGQLASLWESIIGRRWHLWLRGEEIEELPTRRRSIGHQHVLPPKNRNPDDARAIMLRLLMKAAARARTMGYCPQRMSIRVRYALYNANQGAYQQFGWRAGGAGGAAARSGPTQQEAAERGNRSAWGADVPLQHGCQDTLRLVQLAASLWNARPADPGPILLVDVTLHELIPEGAATVPLFAPERSRLALSKAIDALNLRYGRNTIYPGAVHQQRDSAPGGIAFRTIPDLANPDSPGVRHEERNGFPTGFSTKRAAEEARRRQAELALLNEI